MILLFTMSDCLQKIHIHRKYDMNQQNIQTQKKK